MSGNPLLEALQERVLPVVLHSPDRLPLWLQNGRLEARRMSRSVSWGSPPDSRRHLGFEVCFVLDGEASVLIDDACYFIQANDALIVPTNHLHDFSNTSADYDAMWIEVKPTETVVHLQQFRCRSFERNRPGTALRCAFECHATACAIDAELRARRYLYEQVVADEVKRLIIQVIRQLREAAETRSAREQRPARADAVAAAVDIIHGACGEDLSVSSLSQRVFLSTSQLNRLFRREIGMSVWEYIIHVRLARARKLLTTTDLPIQAIASDVGYHSVHHFCRAYKKRYGCTPGESRERA